MELKYASGGLCKPNDLQLQKQLQLSLKFHHREILRQIPRELAVQAMNEAWCNSALTQME